MCFEPALHGLAIFTFIGSILLVGVIAVVPSWIILSKAGLSAPLALLVFVPIANLILLYYVAFTVWPALGTDRKQNQGASAPKPQ
jgi:hypothetical protein